MLTPTSRNALASLKPQMCKDFLEEYGLLLPLLDIMHANQATEVLRIGLACIVNILHEEYKINKLVEAGVVGVVRPLAGHEDEQIQQYVAAVLLAISACPGLEEWLVSAELRCDPTMPRAIVACADPKSCC